MVMMSILMLGFSNVLYILNLVEIICTQPTRAYMSLLTENSMVIYRVANSLFDRFLTSMPLRYSQQTVLLHGVLCVQIYHRLTIK